MRHLIPPALPTQPNATPDAIPGFAKGDVIDGRYRIERELGRGAMGVVFEATESGLARRVALKVITRELAPDAAFADRFIQEARALAAIRHQNIVQVHALGQHQQGWYYAMEYVVGRALDAHVADHIVRGTTFATSAALAIVRQIASGLSAVHAARIIHRDVKPANIVIEQVTGRPVLIDFGISRPAFNGSSRSTMLVGSPAYMAPEQIQSQGSAELTPAADLYALGCVAYELLTLQPPFASSDVYEVLRDQVSRVPDALSTHRPDLARFDNLLARLLAKRPEDRPGSCLAVVRELDRLSAEWESGESAALRSMHPSAPWQENPRVLLLSGDPAFLARAREATSAAFATGWTEVGAGRSPEDALDRARVEPPSLALVHCDSLRDHGVEAVTTLREMQGAKPRVLAFGSALDPFARWRLGSLGVTSFVPAALDARALAEHIESAWGRDRHSALPGARPSTIVLPTASAATRIPLELLLLVTASAWCDGELAPSVASMVLDAARAEGHEPAALEALSRALAAPIELADVDVSEVPTATRAYAYAFATRIALDDDVISAREECTLHVLAYVLGLSVLERTAIQSAVEQSRERGGAQRDTFRQVDFARTVAPMIERALRGPRHAPIPGIALPFRP